MYYTEPFFLISILTGMLFTLVGFIQLKFPPRKINSFYGYRTPTSMRDQARWDFAQRFSAREMIRGGFGLCALAIPGLLAPLRESIGIMLSMLGLLAVVLSMLVRTERAIRKEFGA